jgi:recombination associated protein RdgC
MFKNLIIYRIQANDMDIATACDDLAMHTFTPCSPSQEKSMGWMAPREVNGALIESIGGQWIMKLMTETKAVPADVINRKAAERCVQIEAQTGRKPGKKETRDLKDEIRLELLPHAFTKQSATLVWFDVDAGFLAIDTTSQGRADDVVTALISAVPGLTLGMVNTKSSPSARMADWLLAQEGPFGFSIDRECELKASDESKAVVKYSKHSLDIGEIPDHIMAGKMPTKLAMTWSDRVSFVLTDMQIKRLAFLDVVFEDAGDGKADGFDADVAIATGELRKMIPDLLAALGGEIQL